MAHKTHNAILRCDNTAQLVVVVSPEALFFCSSNYLDQQKVFVFNYAFVDKQIPRYNNNLNSTEKAAYLRLWWINKGRPAQSTLVTNWGQRAPSGARNRLCCHLRGHSVLFSLSSLSAFRNTENINYSSYCGCLPSFFALNVIVSPFRVRNTPIKSSTDSYTKTAACSLSYTLHVAKFYCNVFRLMYKQPPSCW